MFLAILKAGAAAVNSSIYYHESEVLDLNSLIV